MFTAPGNGGWCWERLAPLLAEASHTVVAPDLPGMEREPRALGENVLGEWTDFLADLATAATEPVIPVGHSRGGVVISEVAERVPESIVDPEHCRPIFYNTTPEEDASEAVRRLQPEPAASFTTPIWITQERFGRVRRAYIECTRSGNQPSNAARHASVGALRVGGHDGKVAEAV